MMALEQQTAETHPGGGLGHLSIGGQTREDAGRGVKMQIEGPAHVH